jgi:hypothetical protein
LKVPVKVKALAKVKVYVKVKALVKAHGVEVELFEMT